MIHPVPTGVNPNSHHCGECQGRFRMPWDRERGGHVLICVTDPSHQTYQKKDTGTRILQGREFDIVTQRETTELAPITDEPTALAAVTKANALGMFPSKDSTPDQLALVAHVALLYRLDPNMQEIIPYQGKPYVTIKGRRRLDNVAGNVVGVSHRPPTEDEERYWIKVGAMNPKDVIQICVGKLADGRVVEGFGRVLSTEGMGRNGQLDQHLPLAVRKIEMAQVRSERRMREMAFGPVARPIGLDASIGVLEEGDEANIVEGESHVVDESHSPSSSSPLPNLGTCPEHDVEWDVEERFNKTNGFHSWNGDRYGCKFGSQQFPLFKAAWFVARGEIVDAEINTWLKANFSGKTWSKLEPLEMLDAVRKVKADPSTGEIKAPAATETPGEAPSSADGTDSLPEDDVPQNTHSNTDGRITSAAVKKLLAACGDEVPPLDLQAYVKEQTGESHLGNILGSQYDGILEWINKQVDAKISEAEAQH